jgi:hypothetical protein
MTHADFGLDRRRCQWAKEIPARELQKLLAGWLRHMLRRTLGAGLARKILN